MERVHFYQEQMLPELKEFEEKGIFSQSETRAILKQRTAFESALIRRVALKSDYIKYVQYEITLEALRKKRVARLNATETKTSLSDYSIIRRQFYVLERAVRKFKNDVSLWIHYIELAKSNRARALVGKLCSRALSLHPNSTPLYIIAASHELDTTLSPAGARALLQRGLRINPESVALWTEYVRMELGYCEGLRRRWKTLGLDDASDEDARAREAILSGGIIRAVITSATKALPTLELLGSLQSMLQSYPTELRSQLIEHLHSDFASCDIGSGPSAEDFRCGAALLRATTELPNMPLEGSTWLPRVPHLRPLVAAAFPTEVPQFPPGEQTAEFVRRIQKASEVLGTAGKSDVRIAELYARWVAAWAAVITEKSLSLYLILELTTTASSLCKTKIDKLLLQSLSTILRITLHLNRKISTDKTQLRHLAKKFSKACPHDAGLWLSRLDVELEVNRPQDSELILQADSIGLSEAIKKLWAEARDKAQETPGEEDLLVDLWTWGLQPSERSDLSEGMDLWKAILHQSLSHTSPTLHSMLILRRLYDESQPPNDRAALVKKLINQYRPSTSFFDRAMDQELKILLASRSTPVPNRGEEPPRKKRKKGSDVRSVEPTNKSETPCLEALYTAWRVIPEQNVPAALKWASSLWRLGEEERADDAIRAVGGSKGKLRQEWEKLREEISRARVGSDEDQAKTEDSGLAEPEVGLEDVEFA
ncbi:U3 snoRNP protein [Ceratobasidium sp. 395]|nr:U3 snoRNP protein [Ceratobasidium sp. 395]